MSEEKNTSIPLENENDNDINERIEINSGSGYTSPGVEVIKSITPENEKGSNILINKKI